jgi:hypothetical protein
MGIEEEILKKYEEVFSNLPEKGKSISNIAEQFTRNGVGISPARVVGVSTSEILQDNSATTRHP